MIEHDLMVGHAPAPTDKSPCKDVLLRLNGAIRLQSLHHIHIVDTAFAMHANVFICNNYQFKLKFTVSFNDTDDQRVSTIGYMFANKVNVVKYA